MAEPRTGAPYRVDIPATNHDRPSWMRVGLIAVVGFGVGVAWPRLAGVRLGPSAPSATLEAAARAPEPSAVAHGERAASNPNSTRAAAAPTPASAVASGAAATGDGEAEGDRGTGGAMRGVDENAASRDGVKVAVSKAILISCRTEEGQIARGASCGRAISSDAIAVARLKRMATCPGAAPLNGRYSVLLTLDFAANRVGIAVGKGPPADTSGLLACLQKEFGGVSLGALQHEHPRYTLSYGLTFSGGTPVVGDAPARAPAGSKSGPAVARSAKAAAPADAVPPAGADPVGQVTWNVATVRDAPRIGQVKGTLPRGSVVRVGPMQEGWYKVRFGPEYKEEGWVYRSAIGR